MKECVGVRFKKAGKISYFEKHKFNAQRGQYVIVGTQKGLEYGKVEIASHFLDQPPHPGNRIVRLATEKDHLIHENNKRKEQDAFTICCDKMRKHQLDMKLIDVDLSFDNTKIMFYFTSEHRVDFRALVKDLASIFRMRIELRQIGVRDEAKAINSVGMCGRSLCCSSFLGSFQPVSIKMAKDQGLSLNPTKISGVCGRLMCCLKYEEHTYEELNKNLPKESDVVKTPDGTGSVLAVNVLQQLVKVGIRSKDDSFSTNYYSVEEIKIIKKNNPDHYQKTKIDRNLAKVLKD